MDRRLETYNKIKRNNPPKFKIWNPTTHNMYDRGATIPDIIHGFIKTINHETFKGQAKELDTAMNKMLKDMVFIESVDLNDANGRELYEGDIVEADVNTGVGMVRQLAVMTWVPGEERRWGSVTDRRMPGMSGIQTVHTKPTYKGNVYQNPELLDDEKNKS